MTSLRRMRQRSLVLSPAMRHSKKASPKAHSPTVEALEIQGGRSPRAPSRRTMTSADKIWPERVRRRNRFRLLFGLRSRELGTRGSEAINSP